MGKTEGELTMKRALLLRGAFVPTGKGDEAMTMGDLVLLDSK